MGQPARSGFTRAVEESRRSPGVKESASLLFFFLEFSETGTYTCEVVRK